MECTETLGHIHNSMLLQVPENLWRAATPACPKWIILHIFTQLCPDLICRHLGFFSIVKLVKATWAVWSPFLIRSLCFLMPATWRPFMKRSHITVLGVIDSLKVGGFQPWAEPTCPREWRILHWSPWEQCSHLCISLVKTVSTLTWFSVFALPHPDWFLFCSWTQHKMWPYRLIGPARTCQVANAMAEVHTFLANRADIFVTKPCLSSSFTGCRPDLCCFPGTLLSSSVNSKVFQFACNPLIPENCYLPTQQLQVCQPEHHHSLPRAKWGLRNQLSSCQGEIADRQEALTAAHRGEPAAPPGWMCSTS